MCFSNFINILLLTYTRSGSDTKCQGFVKLFVLLLCSQWNKVLRIGKIFWILICRIYRDIHRNILLDY